MLAVTTTYPVAPAHQGTLDQSAAPSCLKHLGDQPQARKIHQASHSRSTEHPCWTEQHEWVGEQEGKPSQEGIVPVTCGSVVPHELLVSLQRSSIKHIYQ